MSLKQEIETWVEALAQYDNNEFEESLKTFDNISDTSKILFNCGVIHATLGEHDKAVECYQRAVRLDQYLAVAYFQQGVSNFLVGDFEEALANFNDTLLYLRGNTYIDYEQLGLKFKLFSCEVLFNRGLCYIYLQQKVAGMADLSYAAKEKVTPDHDVIDDAIKEQAEGYTVFSIPVGIVYRPNSAKVKNLKTKDYLGKARLIASVDRTNVTTGFAGPEIKRSESTRTERPLDQVSFAASNLVRSDLSSRTRQQSEPPINRNMFPPTPPPEHEQARPALATTRTSPPSNPPPLTTRASSVRNGPSRRPTDRPMERRISEDMISPKSTSLANPNLSANRNSDSASAPGPRPNLNPPPAFIPSSNPAFNPPPNAATFTPSHAPSSSFNASAAPNPFTQPAPANSRPERPERPRIGTTRTASEPRGPTSKFAAPPSSRGPYPPSAHPAGHTPSRGRLFMETIPAESGADDEFSDELYDLYNTTAHSNPYTTASPQTNHARRPSSRTRQRSRSRQRSGPYPSAVAVPEEGGDVSPSGTTHSSLDDFEILNDAGGNLSRPREASRTRPPKQDVRTIRIKVHAGEDTRYLMVSMEIMFEEFLARVREKLGLKGGFKVRVRDEGDLITLGDRDDWEMVVGGCRREARREGGDMGRMEVWIQELAT